MAEDFKQWYIDGLQAVVAANEISKKGAEEGSYTSETKDVSELADDTAAMQERHTAVVEALLKDAGGTTDRRDNPAMSGIYQAINQMIDGAPSPLLKDEGALAGAQLAFHYYIASYGSLAASAHQAGNRDAASQLKQLLEEVKAQDDKYTECANRLMSH